MVLLLLFAFLSFLGPSLCDIGLVAAHEPTPGILPSYDPVIPMQLSRQYGFQIDLGSGSGLQLDAGFQQCAGLGGGSITPRPGIRVPTTITLKQGVIRKSVLDEWLAEIRVGNPGALRTVVVRVMSPDRTRVLRTWRLTRTRVNKYTGPGLTAKGTDEISIESLVLTCEGVDID